MVKVIVSDHILKNASFLGTSEKDQETKRGQEQKIKNWDIPDRGQEPNFSIFFLDGEEFSDTLKSPPKESTGV